MAHTSAEIARLFLKLGTIAFGGPAAHIALMRDEVVRRRRWVDDARFLDLLGMTNLIPGPNSTELAIHLGYVRGGWPGLILAGVCFITPAMVIVGALAWAYVRYGARPEVAWVLYGIKPVIIAIVLQAIWGLLRTAVKSPLLAAVGVAAFALALAGVNELAVLVAGALVPLLVQVARRRLTTAPAIVLALGGAGAPAAATTIGTSISVSVLFLTFLKIGSVLYGSGYVLIAFLRADFVERLGWLTDQQLLDAVAIGQFTPGPVFTTATFVGYVLAGWTGAGLATLAIFLPSFVFVAASHPVIPRIRGSARTAALLDGVNVAALGLMAAVTVTLARAAVVDALTAIVALVAAAILLSSRINSAWLIAGGGLIGVGARLLSS
jgi:chromate transporter